MLFPKLETWRTAVSHSQKNDLNSNFYELLSVVWFSSRSEGATFRNFFIFYFLFLLFFYFYFLKSSLNFVQWQRVSLRVSISANSKLTKVYCASLFCFMNDFVILLE